MSGGVDWNRRTSVSTRERRSQNARPYLVRTEPVRTGSSPRSLVLLIALDDSQVDAGSTIGDGKRVRRLDG